VRSAKYGRPYLRFERFPFFPGQLVECALDPGKGIRDYRKITYTLRCVEDVTETHGSGKNRSTTTVCYQLYADHFEIDQPGSLGAQGQGVPVTFLLPEDVPTMDLWRPAPRYWELVVKADTPGVDFKATFLVPVYAEVNKQRALKKNTQP
jgi:hypothetical protein